ncbi:MAG: hypothetical protein ABIC40_08080 [bacterium]
MARSIIRIISIILVLLIFSALSCKGGKPAKTPEPTPGGLSGPGAGLGRYAYDVPTPFTDVGTLDMPRMVRTSSGDVQLVYIVNSQGSHRVMYTRLEKGQFRQPSILSQEEGRKLGGGYLASGAGNNFIAYWINVEPTGGQLRYKESSNGGKSFTLESKWNRLKEIRWPLMIPVGDRMIGYYFTEDREGWKMVVGATPGSGENEPVVDIVQGTPFNLQGVTDSRNMVRLMYFTRVESSDGRRLAFLSSDDGGATFSRKYLFDDRVIPNRSSFFAFDRSVSGKDEVLHLIFAEETEEYTTLYYSRSEDGGINFTTPVQLVQSDEPLTSSPLLMANKDYVFIATADAQDDGPALRYLISEDMGKSFEPPAVATRSVGNPETIAGIIDNNGRVILVWDDLANTKESGECLYKLEGTLRGQ